MVDAKIHVIYCIPAILDTRQWPTDENACAHLATRFDHEGHHKNVATAH